MKNKLTYIVVTIAFFTQIGVGFSHALYIDTQEVGEIGEAQKVSVYYSEFKDRTHEKVTDWYSDVAEFELWLVSPDGKRMLLETTAKENHFATYFTPKAKGTYRLEINHTAAAVADGTAYQFNTYAQVVVAETSNDLHPVKAKQDLVLLKKISAQTTEISFQVYFKGLPKTGISATLFLPSGKTKTLESNTEGIFSFQATEEGIHFIEATTYHEKEAGKTTKEAYTAIWRCATQKFEL